MDRINFNGDADQPQGSGEMNLDRQIKLTFYTLVGHGELTSGGAGDPADRPASSSC